MKVKQKADVGFPYGYGCVDLEGQVTNTSDYRIRHKLEASGFCQR